MQALLSGQIDAHFTSPPYQWQEQLGRGAHVVGKSYGYFGAHSFLVTVLTQKFYDEYRTFSNRFYRLVKQSIDLINKKPKAAAAILAREDQTGGHYRAVHPLDHAQEVADVHDAATWAGCGPPAS